MKLLTCGDRNWTDRETIQVWIEYFKKNHSPLETIHGGAPGADTIAGEIAQWLAVRVRSFQAEWSKYGRAAGPIRNRYMLDTTRPDAVLAFHNDLARSKGTKHMYDLASKRHIPRQLIRSEDRP